MYIVLKVYIAYRYLKYNVLINIFTEYNSNTIHANTPIKMCDKLKWQLIVLG